MQEQSIFIEALERTVPAERAAFLDEACGQDAVLRRRIERLLERYQQADSFLDSPAVAPAATVETPYEQPGAVIGPYKLLEQIGEGGFGVVYMAQQQEPIRRRVALKILKPGMDSKQIIARFEAERQALALMDHPHIAKVLDAGHTATGRPYFVMGLVKGIPITDFADQNQLPLRQRLELFIAVCQAVQHAHQKGVIHRDLKPSNVLVTMQDGSPVVKVIDFGIAKALGQQLTDKTLFTGFNQMIGTPLYMSPEQAALSNVDVDTRSDVYSLGVLLYELLTGTTPFDRQRLKEVGYDEMRRIIREEEAPRPSTRISTLGQAATTISAQRQSDPWRLSRLCRGELDWMVMKALEKDRNRRYESVSAFATDVQRYLHDEPVLACPPSTWYRLRKLMRRRRVALLVTLLFALASISITSVIAWSEWDRATRQARIGDNIGQLLDQADHFYRDRQLPQASHEVDLAWGLLEAGGAAEEMREKVQQWRRDLTTATQLEELQLAWFMADANDRPRAAAAYARAFRGYGIDVETLAPAEAATKISASRTKADLVSALDEWALRATNNPGASSHTPRQRLKSIADMVDSDPWERRYRQAARTKDLRTLKAMAKEVDMRSAEPSALAGLGSALRIAGSLTDAVAFLSEAQRYHPSNVTILCKLIGCLHHVTPIAVDNILRFQSALVAVRPKSPVAHLQLARALSYKGDFSASAADCQEAIRLNPDYADAHLFLADMLYYRQHHPRQGLVEYSRAVELRPKNTMFRTRRGFAYLTLGDRAAALADFSEINKLQPQRAAAWLALGHFWLRAGDSAKAMAEFSHAITVEPSSAPAWAGRGEVHLQLNHWTAAVADCTQAVKLKADYWMAYRTRANAYVALRQWDKAIADFSRILNVSPHDTSVRIARARAYQALGQTEKATADYALVERRQKNGAR